MDEDLPLLMVFGGSLGALKINDALYEALRGEPANFQVVHLTGQADNSFYEALAEKERVPVKILTGTTEMQNFFQAADLIICRAGASSLAEIASFGKPALFIPFRAAAENCP